MPRSFRSVSTVLGIVGPVVLMLCFLDNTAPAVAQTLPVEPIAVSTFDTDDEGWRVFYDTEGILRRPTFIPSGGNPGGYVSFIDQKEQALWYWNAPAKFLGDTSAAYGQGLTFDLTQSDTANPHTAVIVDVILTGAGQTLTFDTSHDPGLTWTPYLVVLKPSAGWKVAATGQIPTNAEMLAVLQDLTALSIRGEYHIDVDTGGLDNVALGRQVYSVFLPSVLNEDMFHAYLPLIRK